MLERSNSHTNGLSLSGEKNLFADLFLYLDSFFLDPFPFFQEHCIHWKEKEKGLIEQVIMNPHC